MNKNIIYLAALFFAFFMASCSTKPVVITSNINAPVEHVTLSNQMQMTFDTIYNVQGGSVSIDLPDGPTILEFNVANLKDYIFAEPGQNIGVSVTNEGEIVIDGGNPEAQKLINEVSQKLSEANGKNGLPKIGKYEPTEFLDAVSTKYEEVEALISNSSVSSEQLKKWLNSRVAASKMVDYANYPQFYNYYHDTDPPATEEITSAIENFDFNNKELYYFDEMKTAAEAIIMNDVNFYDSPSISAYYSSIYSNIDKYVTQPEIKEMLQYKILVDKITNSGGIDGMKEEILAFIDQVKAPHRKSAIQSMLNEWAHLEAGKPAPDFPAYTRDGKEVKLSDLQGKNVYIDVWATWCGPCIREIPSLKEMEEKYHDENIEFVSVSIDRLSDKEKWSKFIDEKELKGLQIFAPNDWRSEIATSYNIKGIPRFIMVDDEGKIVSASAPRPSNGAGLEQMFAEVLN